MYQRLIVPFQEDDGVPAGEVADSADGSLRSWDLGFPDNSRMGSALPRVFSFRWTQVVQPRATHCGALVGMLTCCDRIWGGQWAEGEARTPWPIFLSGGVEDMQGQLLAG